MRPYICLHIHGSIWKWVSQFTEWQTSSIVWPYWWCFFGMDTWRKRTSQIYRGLKNHKPKIKFTCTSSKNCFNFLELDVQLSQRKITTNLHIKPTDRYLCLHFTWFHPKQTKRSIVYSQALKSKWDLFHGMWLP